MIDRLSTLKQLLLEQGVDGALISKKANIFYFTGLHSLHPIEREAYLLITPTQNILLHSPFVYSPSNQFFQSTPISATQNLSQILASTSAQVSNFGYESQNLIVSEFDRVKTILDHSQFTPIDQIIISLRTIKDDNEILQINSACKITEATLAWTKQYAAATKNLTELSLTRAIENHYLDLGADGTAFPTIVAFGAHTSEPHHVSTSTILTDNTPILIDTGALVHEYCSDYTRSWWYGEKVPELYTKIKTIVSHAFTTAKSMVNPNIRAKEIDQAAREIIVKAGFGDNFIHSTGHGLGLEAHEDPSLNSKNDQKLISGMAITIEPGIYLPNTFGYRHEDTVLVK